MLKVSAADLSYFRLYFPARRVARDVVAPFSSTSVKKMAAFRRTLLPVLPGNVSQAEQDSCSLGLDEGTVISSNRSSPVECGEKSGVKEDSESLGEDQKEAGNSRSKSSGIS